VAVKPIKERDQLRFSRTGRKGKALLNGASCMCRHIAKQLKNRKPLDTGIRSFDASVPGEFALCSMCARYFVAVGPEETARQLRMVRLPPPKRKRGGRLSAPVW
jgi:hypothetical protein